MSDEKSLEEKILEDIKKTGFPTEILSGRIMSNRHWFISYNPSYLDRNEGVSREFDIEASQQWIANRLQPSNQAIIGTHLIIDCKKSKNPWVFFNAPEIRTVPFGDFIKTQVKFPLFYNSDDYKKSVIGGKELESYHHYFKDSIYARTYYEAFKGQETTQLIYKAVLSVTEATLFNQKQRTVPGYIGIYYPVIIFEGKMFEADVRSSDEIILSEKNHIKLNYNFVSNEIAPSGDGPAHYRFLIDVVNINFLDKFMELIEEEQVKFTKIVENLLDQGKIAPYKGDVVKTNYK